MAQTFALRRYFFCKTITITSTTTKPGMRSSRFLRSGSSYNWRAPRNNFTIRNSCLILIVPRASVGLGWRRKEPISESWGTFRYGRLAEVLLYDVRRIVRSPGRAPSI